MEEDKAPLSTVPAAIVMFHLQSALRVAEREQNRPIVRSLLSAGCDMNLIESIDDIAGKGTIITWAEVETCDELEATHARARMIEVFQGIFDKLETALEADSEDDEHCVTSDHWLFAEGAEPAPMPLRMGEGEARAAMVKKVTAAARYAFRRATENGTKISLAPDELVQNFIVGMIGYSTADGTVDDAGANPHPLPPQYYGIEWR